MKALMLLFAALLLLGCAVSPNKLGITDSEWKTYSKAKQEKLIADYQSLNIEASNEDIKNNSRYITAQNSLYTGRLLRVRVYDGEALLPPFTNWQLYDATRFRILPETCVNVPIYARGNKNYTSNLRVCYKSNVLLLDPSRYDVKKKDGTIRLPQSLLWDDGFTYHGIYTDGFVKLRNATIEVFNEK